MTLKKLCHFSESELGIDFVEFTAVTYVVYVSAGRSARLGLVNVYLLPRLLLVVLIISGSGKLIGRHTADLSIRLLTYNIM